MEGLSIRHVEPKDFESLRQRLKENHSEALDLERMPCWIAEDDGKVIGVLGARLVWQLQPLLIFPETKNKITRSRACFHLYRVATAWLGNRDLNRTGIHWFFAVTYSKGVKAWAKRLGWFRQYKGTAFFIKHL